MFRYGYNLMIHSIPFRKPAMYHCSISIDFSLFILISFIFFLHGVYVCHCNLIPQGIVYFLFFYMFTKQVFYEIRCSEYFSDFILIII